jgi:predicted CXXCH cytochrome family protein
MHAGTIEHPGILHKEDNCSSCHVDKTRGKSVHSAMEVPCTVCHLAQTQGDMTTLQLSLPKTEICFSCHEKTMMSREHATAAKKICVDCHDAHSSNRRMLLLDPLNGNRHNSSLMLPPTKGTTR